MHIGNWFHHLFNPHCPECLAEKEDAKRCLNCENYLLLLEKERVTNRELITFIMDLNKQPVEPKTTFAEIPQPINRNVSWNKMRERMEALDREKAKRYAQEAQVAVDKNKSTQQLEKELLYGENDAPANA